VFESRSILLIGKLSLYCRIRALLAGHPAQPGEIGEKTAEYMQKLSGRQENAGETSKIFSGE
jgi:hypothetical protein